MDLIVLNRELEPIGVLDNYYSFIWVKKYYKSSEFELTCLFTIDNLSLLKRDNIIYKGNGEAGFIEFINLTLDEDGKEIIKVKGKSLTSYLSRRIIWGHENLNGNAENAMRTVVSNHCIAAPVERVIPNLELGQLNNYTELIEKQVSYKQVKETIEDISKTSDLGHRIDLDYNNKKLIFNVYKGINRTVNQSTVAPCIFSRDFENVLDQDYTDSINNYKNVALIGGTGEGAARRTSTYGFKTGLDRYELFVDAKDIKDTKTISVPKVENGEIVLDDEGNTVYQNTDVALTDVEYIPLLKQRGNEKLSENTELKTFESTINLNSNLKYKEDFDLGDIVTVMDKSWGLTIDTRITEIQEVYENKGLSINVTFGNNIPQLIDKIRNLVR